MRKRFIKWKDHVHATKQSRMEVALKTEVNQQKRRTMTLQQKMDALEEELRKDFSTTVERHFEEHQVVEKTNIKDELQEMMAANIRVEKTNMKDELQQMMAADIQSARQSIQEINSKIVFDGIETAKIELKKDFEQQRIERERKRLASAKKQKEERAKAMQMLMQHEQDDHDYDDTS